MTGRIPAIDNDATVLYVLTQTFRSLGGGVESLPCGAGSTAWLASGLSRGICSSRT